MKENRGHTLERLDQLGVAVRQGWNTCRLRVEFVAGFDEALTCRNIAPKSGALGSFRIVVHREWSVASEVGHGRHLSIRICETVGEDDTSQVNML